MNLSLYLHYPFCTNKCSYCDFYKELHDDSLERKFFDALKTETELTLGGLEESATIKTIFIGGGTPSLIRLDELAGWLEQLKSLAKIDDSAEFSFESNPESITLENLTELKHLGVNRPVFGIQSFNTGLLAMLDRRHNPHHSRRAVYYANALGFSNFGVDLIFGMPSQTSRMMSDDLDQIIDLEPPHVSFYQLTVEPGTPLSIGVESGQLQMPDQELCLAMYRGGCEKLTESGFVRYEVSSFARPGFECRHNLGYWQGSEYIGLGPSAHSFLEDRRYMNESSLTRYIERLNKGELAHVVDESGVDERITEAIMLGLRTAEGLSRGGFSRRFGLTLESRLDEKQLELLVKSGHIVADRNGYHLTDKGILLADEITRRLLK